MNSVLFEQIIGVDPKNDREKYTNIEELAYDIARIGLLQNLVVFEVEKDRFLVKQGCRRYLAIKMLVERGVWPKDRPINAIVLTFGDVTTENLQRIDLAPWEIAKKAAEYEEHGLTQEQIGQRIGKSQSNVSRYLAIHRNLHPRVRKAMVNLWPTCLTFVQIYEIACIIDPVTEEPLEEAQVERMSVFLGKPRHSRMKPKERNERAQMLKRIEHLRKAVVPLNARPYVESVIEYLEGKKKRLTFPRGI